MGDGERDAGSDADTRETSDGGAPGALLRTLLAEAIGAGNDPDAFAALDGSVAVVERGDDPGPADRIADVVAGGDSIVGVVPRVEASLARRMTRDDIVEGGDEVRLVFTGRAGERLAGGSGVALRTVLSARGVDPYLHGGDSPVGILLVGDRAIVGLFDGEGLAALLWSDAPAVREWAATTCRRYLDASEPA
ncbi:hypothetical protein [Halorubrum trueperi]|uniref:Methanogenesis regulatory protein FilR1 middle domain-containing protein n=1 Tax=Halorubrum trueperi TaxID=2004704 RepID=A0ABD5US54_9EURY